MNGVFNMEVKEKYVLTPELLQLLVNYDDIITCQEGKLRCRKVKVLQEIK